MHLIVCRNYAQHMIRTRRHSILPSKVLTQPASRSLRASDANVPSGTSIPRATPPRHEGCLRAGGWTTNGNPGPSYEQPDNPCHDQTPWYLPDMPIEYSEAQVLPAGCAPMASPESFAGAHNASPLIASQGMRPRHLGRCVLCSSPAAQRLGSVPRDRRLPIS